MQIRKDPLLSSEYNSCNIGLKCVRLHLNTQPKELYTEQRTFDNIITETSRVQHYQSHIHPNIGSCILRDPQIHWAFALPSVFIYFESITGLELVIFVIISSETFSSHNSRLPTYAKICYFAFRADSEVFYHTSQNNNIRIIMWSCFIFEARNFSQCVSSHSKKNIYDSIA